MSAIMISEEENLEWLAKCNALLLCGMYPPENGKLIFNKIFDIIFIES